MSDDRIRIRDKTGNEQTVVESAYRKVWSKRGWTPVEDESSGKSITTAGRQTDASGYSNTDHKE